MHMMVKAVPSTGVLSAMLQRYHLLAHLSQFQEFLLVLEVMLPQVMSPKSAHFPPKDPMLEAIWSGMLALITDSSMLEDNKMLEFTILTGTNAMEMILKSSNE